MDDIKGTRIVINIIKKKFLWPPAAFRAVLTVQYASFNILTTYNMLTAFLLKQYPFFV